jgi:hypothetical protein
VSEGRKKIQELVLSVENDFSRQAIELERTHEEALRCFEEMKMKEVATRGEEKSDAMSEGSDVDVESMESPLVSSHHNMSGTTIAGASNHYDHTVVRERLPVKVVQIENGGESDYKEEDDSELNYHVDLGDE